mmetsp:Transcript_15299/g.36347  ORF Transcript_15299/g.36347 Transcript_15299/m.36347 type:complete len:372 (+) Transcript_15299:2910-4025(+)
MLSNSRPNTPKIERSLLETSEINPFVCNNRNAVKTMSSNRRLQPPQQRVPQLRPAQRRGRGQQGVGKLEQLALAHPHRVQRGLHEAAEQCVEAAVMQRDLKAMLEPLGQLGLLRRDEEIKGRRVDQAPAPDLGQLELQRHIVGLDRPDRQQIEAAQAQPRNARAHSGQTHDLQAGSTLDRIVRPVLHQAEADGTQGLQAVDRLQPLDGLGQAQSDPQPEQAAVKAVAHRHGAALAVDIGHGGAQVQPAVLQFTERTGLGHQAGELQLAVAEARPGLLQQQPEHLLAVAEPAVGHGPQRMPDDRRRSPRRGPANRPTHGQRQQMTPTQGIHGGREGGQRHGNELASHPVRAASSIRPRPPGVLPGQALNPSP